jgi:hypothetical protein
VGTAEGRQSTLKTFAKQITELPTKALQITLSQSEFLLGFLEWPPFFSVPAGCDAIGVETRWDEFYMLFGAQRAMKTG